MKKRSNSKTKYLLIFSYTRIFDILLCNCNSLINLFQAKWVEYISHHPQHFWLNRTKWKALDPTNALRKVPLKYLRRLADKANVLWCFFDIVVPSAYVSCRDGSEIDLRHSFISFYVKQFDWRALSIVWLSI